MATIRTGSSAGIFFSESSIQYAIIRHGDENKLERLGACDFDLDILEHFRSGITSGIEETLSEAITDVLADADVSQIFVGMHPAISRTFFTLTDASASSEDASMQFKSESRLLFGRDTDFHTVSSDLHHVIDQGTDVRRNWHMVTLVSSTVKAPIDRMLSHVGSGKLTYVSSIEAAANLVKKNQPNARAGEFSLLVGQFGDVVDMTILSDGNIISGHTVNPENEADYLYWLVVLTTRLDIPLTSISKLYFHGDELEPVMFDDIEHATHAEIVAVDPFRLADIDVGSVRPDFESARYASCLGMII